MECSVERRVLKNPLHEWTAGFEVRKDMIPGFRIYTPILNRLGDCRQVGPQAISFRCPFTDRHKNGDNHPSGRAKIGGNGQLIVRCFGCGAQINDFAKFTDFPLRAFWPDGWSAGGSVSRPAGAKDMDARQQPQQHEVARYEYRTPTGERLATKIRLEPGRDGRAKEFTWERPIDPLLCQAAGLPAGSVGYARSLSDGELYPVSIRGEAWCFAAPPPETQWQPGRCSVKVPRVVPGLYRQERITKLPAELPLFLVEGEKDVNTLVGVGFEAFCPPHGSNTWQSEWSALFDGRQVIVIPDNDQPGLQHGEKILGSLIAFGVAGVKYLRPGYDGYDPPAFGGDVTDWFGRSPLKRKAEFLSVLGRVKSYRSYLPTQGRRAA